MRWLRRESSGRAHWAELIVIRRCELRPHGPAPPLPIGRIRITAHISDASGSQTGRVRVAVRQTRRIRVADDGNAICNAVSIFALNERR